MQLETDESGIVVKICTSVLADYCCNKYAHKLYIFTHTHTDTKWLCTVQYWYLDCHLSVCKMHSQHFESF